MIIMGLDEIWDSYGLDALKQGLDGLFPEYTISLEDLLSLVLQGDLGGAVKSLLESCVTGIGSQLGGLREFLVWLLLLGVASSLIAHFSEIFDRHHLANVTFLFIYLLLITVLLKGFQEIAGVASQALEDIVLFIKLLIPTYCLCVGVATGTLTAGACYELLLLLIYGVENILVSGLLPFIYSYVLLSAINGIWIEEKLNLLIDLLERGIKLVLKTAAGLVTGISIFQAAITPVLDSVKSSALQKAIAAIPGLGGAANSCIELAVGAAVVIKNSVGIVLLLVLLGLCIAPLVRIFLMACLLKCAAAIMGIISDKRLVACMNRIGEGSMLLFQMTGTALMLFLISLSVVALSSGRGL